MKSIKVNKRFKKSTLLKPNMTNRTVYGLVDFMNAQRQRPQGHSTSIVSFGMGPAHISHTDKFIMLALKIAS